MELYTQQYVFIAWCLVKHRDNFTSLYIQGPFEKFVDWQQCASVLQSELVTVMASCRGGGNIVVA
jgi:hypothetical protein